jgi:AcrR family transcriptional regulator
MDTKEAIKTEFLREYGRKRDDRISVKELCANTPVARTTFYSYYNNMDEVKEEIENELISRLEEVNRKKFHGDIENMDFNVYLWEIQKVIKDNWRAFYVFLVRQPNLRFIEKWKNSIQSNFLRRYPEKRSIRNHELITSMVGAATIEGYSCWMKNPESVSVDDMIRTITDVLTAVSETI